MLGLYAGRETRDGRELWLRLRLSDAAPLRVVLGVPSWMPSASSIAVLLAQLAALLLTRMKLRSEMLPDSEVRERLQADLSEMQGLVEEGLEYARTAHAGVEPERRVDLHALLDSLAFDYQDAGRSVRWAGKHEAPLWTRPQALRRVVMNLVDNALEFGGQAEIALDSSQDSVVIAVKDRGPGIAPDQLARVFEPFVRLDDSRSRDTGGAGLGLAIAQELTSVLRGTLALRNREGGGLEARLSLPV